MESNTLKAGSRLKNGEYSIIRVLGQGGFGITYEAEQTGLRRKVAVKEFFMKDSCERNESTSYVTVPTASNRDLVTKFRDKFVRESRMIAALDNEHIVKVHDVFEENGTAYYVMEYLDGGSLNGRMRDRGAMPEAEALGYVRQIADALQYLHSQNILHFDVKPSNVLMGRNGRAKLIDFGISKHYDESGHQTSSTPVGISKGFAPLEQYKQGSDLSSFTPATDIYALGATLYALLAGENPPEASDVSEDGLPIIDGVSPTVMHAIESAMQPRRKDRPQSVVEFLGLLDGGSKDNGGADRAEHGASVKDDDSEDTVINGGNAGGGGSVSSGSKTRPKSADSGKTAGGKKSSAVKWIAGGAAVFFLVLSLFLLLPKGQKPEPVPDSILIDGMRECTAEFESRASEREFRIEKNFGERWAYSGVPDWCSTVPAEGRLSLKVTENKTKEDRVAAIEFRKEGGSVVLSRLTISQKAKAVVPQKPTEKEFGALKITSVPPGASIWIDGRNTRKTTPEIIEDLSVGKHRIVLKLSGYEDCSRSVTLNAKSDNRVSVDMTANRQQIMTSTVSASETFDSGTGGMSFEEESVEEEAIPFPMVEEKPKFRGGDANEFSKWVAENLKYPEDAKENGVQGRVMLSFKVNTDGSVSNVKVLRGVDTSLDEEAVRVISKSPKWTPGKQRDRTVAVTYTFPVIFQLK